MTKKKDDTVIDPVMTKRVEQYIAIRDKLKTLADEHELRIAPLVQMQNMISGWLQSVLDKVGPEASIKTSVGTCYSSTRYTASLADADAFMKHVIETGNFDLLDRRANGTMVREYAKANEGRLPPGVNLSALRTVGVRRRSGVKKEE